MSTDNKRRQYESPLAMARLKLSIIFLSLPYIVSLIRPAMMYASRYPLGDSYTIFLVDDLILRQAYLFFQNFVRVQESLIFVALTPTYR
jgi:hypothetical protein